jgi:hypothetical protein
VNGAPPVVSAPSPTSTGAYTAPIPGGGSVTCTAASTAGGYGRTCFVERPDGGFGVVGASGFGMIGADGRVYRSGVIDRRDYFDTAGGSLNVAEAAAFLAAGGDYVDAALRFDCIWDLCIGEAAAAAAAATAAVLTVARVVREHCETNDCSITLPHISLPDLSGNKSEARRHGGGKNAQHGDAGRRKAQNAPIIAGLERELADLMKNQGPKKDKEKLRDKIKNLRREGEDAEKGEQHSQTPK